MYISFLFTWNAHASSQPTRLSFCSSSICEVAPLIDAISIYEIIIISSFVALVFISIWSTFIIQTFIDCLGLYDRSYFAIATISILVAFFPPAHFWVNVICFLTIVQVLCFIYFLPIDRRFFIDRQFPLPKKAGCLLLMPLASSPLA
jgi:hypothetical protein